MNNGKVGEEGGKGGEREGGVDTKPTLKINFQNGGDFGFSVTGTFAT